MFPYPFPFSGVPSGAGLELTAEFAPLFLGIVLLLSLCALGLAAEGWIAQMRVPQEVPLRLVRKRFVCPTQEREVEVDFFASRGEAGKLLAVKSCSAFIKRDEMDCNQACLRLAHG